MEWLGIWDRMGVHAEESGGGVMRDLVAAGP